MVIEPLHRHTAVRFGDLGQSIGLPVDNGCSKQAAGCKQEAKKPNCFCLLPLLCFGMMIRVGIHQGGEICIVLDATLST